MGEPAGAKTDFGVLRQYANHLTGCCELIDRIVTTLHAGPVPRHVWGVPGVPGALIGNPHLSDHTVELWDRPLETGGEVVPELAAFKATYELAHAVTVERIEQLSLAFGRAGDVLRHTAGRYEELEGIDPVDAPSTPGKYQLPGPWGDAPDSGFQAEQDGRRSVWELTGGDGVYAALVETGFGDTIPMFDAYIGVNTDQLKRIALLLYGHTKTYGKDWKPTGGGQDDQIDPDNFEYSNTYAPWALDQIQLASREFMQESVGANWEGDGFGAFEEYHEALIAVTYNESFRLRRIGEALYNAAEVIEQGSKEIEESIAGATGLLLEGVSTARSLKDKIDPLDVSLMVAQKGLGAVQQAEEGNAQQSAEAQKYSEGGEAIKDIVLAAPSTNEALPKLPEVDIDDWDRI